jgi:4-hydroxythreonine-4-phosphate dehydrogenase
VGQAIVLTPGEPAGIGPEIACCVAPGHPDVVLVADPDLLRRTLDRLDLRQPVHVLDDLSERRAGGVNCLAVDMARPEVPGTLNPANAAYVIETLRRSADCCFSGQAGALVTGPVHKGVINEAGQSFSGHTEFLAECAGVETVVMLLCAESLRVALATTHLPLSAVPSAITDTRLDRCLRVLASDLTRRFGIKRPRIAVLGLNPHAGEGGHLGREEIEIIAPLIERLRGEGLDLVGPLPADTAFVADRLRDYDAVLAMYHDQGLPVLKYAGFGTAVNVTLGLPFVRTSVDHGTALDIAGKGRAESGSLAAALELAAGLAARAPA